MIIFATFYNNIVMIKNYKELFAFIREEDKGLAQRVETFN